MARCRCRSAAGVLLNAVFPTWVITFSLIALLCYLTARTTATGLRLHALEARLLGMQQQYGSGRLQPGGAVGPHAAGAAGAEKGQEGERRPLLGGGGGSSRSEDQASPGQETAAGRASPGSSSGGGGSTPGSARRSLLAGLSIPRLPWRSREGGGRGSSLESEGLVGSWEEGAGGSGGRAGPMQRELSMQHMSGPRRSSRLQRGSGGEEEGRQLGGEQALPAVPSLSASPVTSAASAAASPSSADEAVAAGAATTLPAQWPGQPEPPDAVISISTLSSLGRPLTVKLLPSPFVTPGLLGPYSESGQPQAQPQLPGGPASAAASPASARRPLLQLAPSGSLEGQEGGLQDGDAFEAGLHEEMRGEQVGRKGSVMC